jgi:hypothetical protein
VGRSGHEGDHRDAGADQPVHGRDHPRIVRGLEHDALRAARRDPVEGVDDLAHRCGLREVEPRPDDGGRMPGSSASNAARTPLENRVGASTTRSTTNVARPGEAGALPVQVLDGLVDLGDGAGPTRRGR